MKQSDIFAMILVAGIGVLASFFACNALLGDPDLATTQFTELKEAISSNLEMPNPEVFNSTAINPTIEVYVGGCEDIDQNGMLDTAELIACGKIEAPVEEMNPEEGGENGGTTD